MKHQELLQQIEAYLNDSLPAEQRQAWEQRMAEDSDLRREVELHRQLQKDYDSGRIQLRANLNNIINEPLPSDPPLDSGGKFRWGIWLGLLLVGLALCWGIWQRQSPVTVAPEVKEQVLPKSPSAPPSITPETTPVLPKPPKPMAMADPARFKPNPGMEAFVRGGIRSETIAVQMSRPTIEEQFKLDKNNSFQIQFKGTCQLLNDQPVPELIVSIFNNRNTSEPLFSLPVKGLVSAGTLNFELHRRFKFVPGLYYFTVEEVTKGEVLYAGKFLVDN